MHLFRRWAASDVVYLLTGYVVGGSFALAFIATASSLVGDTFSVPRLSAADLPLWVTAPVALVALDLGNYVAHSLLHRVPALWEFHKVHHSIETLDWLATFRSHIVEQTLRRLVAPVLSILAGFPADAVALAGGIFLAWPVLTSHKYPSCAEVRRRRKSTYSSSVEVDCRRLGLGKARKRSSVELSLTGWVRTITKRRMLRVSPSVELYCRRTRTAR